MSWAWLTLLCLGESFSGPNWGTVTTTGDANARQVVLAITDQDSRAAAALVGPERLVVQVRAAAVLAALAQSPTCAYPAARLEELSHYVQMKLGFGHYLQPALLGVGSGSALALASLAQGPPNTFSGVVTLDFCPNLTPPKSLCRGRSLRMEGAGGTMRPPERISEPWLALTSPRSLCAVENIRIYTARVHTAQVQEIDADPNAQIEPLRAAVHGLQPLGEPPPPPASPGAPEVRDLPVVEVAAVGDSNGTFGAVIMSGDGGWASIDREIAETFASQGIPVAGLSSLQYFWKARDPDSAAADLARLIEHYRATWHKSHMLVVGFSLGADVLPFMLSRLPAATQERVKYVALLGPSTAASFEFHLTDWLGGSAAHNAQPVLPELQKLDCKRLMCMYASQDGESPCPQLTCANRVRIPGGHHFGGDYPALAQRILKAVAALDAAPQN